MSRVELGFLGSRYDLRGTARKSLVSGLKSRVHDVILKILTLNTWQERGPWRERWELIFAGLKFYLPDIIGFQEVFNMEWADEIQKRSGYPYLIKSGQPSGLIFLSKYAPVDSECWIMKSKSPSEDYNRYAHFALFQVGMKYLAGFNTHLSWILSEEEVRLKQVKELSQLVKRKSCGGWKNLFQSHPAFILGDFNAAPNRPSIQAVKGLWEDTYSILNPGDPGLTWDYRNPFAERVRDHMPERRIDYIWTRGLAGLAKKSKIVFDQPDANGTYPSDHLGVMTEIEWK